jgi:CRISPR-associated protein (TIGR02710 family)
MKSAQPDQAVRPVDASEPADRPVFLICTVGGSAQPIATALRLLRPDAVWFLVSDGRTGESSASQVETAEIDYDKARGIHGPGLKFADDCPKETAVFKIPADDPDGAYKLCRSHLADARRRYAEHRLIADYTGGTKSMTGGLLMAAFAEPGIEVQFMAGERPDLVQVKPGSEQPQRMAADFIMAERDFAAAEQAVRGYDYAAAQLLLDDLNARLARLEVKPPKAWSRRLQRARAWTGVMAQWDGFNHREAAQRARAEASVEAALDASGHLRALIELGKREKGKPGWDICADLWLNALRRGERGRYDDAVARLYRLLEAAAQSWVFARYRVTTGRMAPSELPDSLRSCVFMKTDRKDGAEYAQLGLNHTVELLRCRDAGDAFVQAYASDGTQEDRLQGPAWLVKRNNSILAHGFVRVDSSAWDEARSWIETRLAPFFHDAGCRQLPREIPPLDKAAV